MIKLNNDIIAINHFPDKTLLIKEEGKWGGRGTHKIEWYFENNEELIALIFLVKHLRSYDNTCDINLIMPYVPNARQDRVKNSEDIFTLKYFCEIINSLNFRSVMVLDAHSNVSLALLNNVEQLPVEPHITMASNKIWAEIKETPVFYFPDEGAMKRYSEHAPGPYAFGIKKRDWETGQIQGIQIQNEKAIKGKNILIVDDICSKGGTFYYSAKALKEAGAANIYLYVTHLEESVLSGDLWKAMNDNELIEKIYTANPLFDIVEPISNFIVRV